VQVCQTCITVGYILNQPTTEGLPKLGAAFDFRIWFFSSSVQLRPLQTVRTKPVCIFQTVGKGRSSLLEVSLDQRAPVQRCLCDVTKTSTPVTKTLSNFTILSYRDVDTSVVPFFTSKALFVAGKGRFDLTQIGPKKCEGSRNFSIVWFLQLGFSRRLEWL